jgi:hypothetical protein
MYKTVYDLNEEEIAELRSAAFNADDDFGDDLRETFEFESNVPRSVLETHHEDFFFTDDDFFCNIKE